MKKIILFLSLLLILSESIALAVVFTGVMDNRSGFPFIPGFTGHSRAWVTGGDSGAGLRLEWQAENETIPGSWTYTYRMVRNTDKNKGFGFFDIETAADFTTANIKSSQVISVTDPAGAPVSSGITISGFQNFTSHHDFTNAAVTEANSQTVLNKSDLSHYSGDPGRAATGIAGGNSSATLSAGPVSHPFNGIRVTFPGSFATLQIKGYDASEWSFSVVCDRVPMWGHVFGWGDQTVLSPFWYADMFSNHIDDLRTPLNLTRLTLAPIDSLTGADPYQGWVLVPGPLPSVLSTNPADTSTEVPVSEPVTAFFSGLMEPATISPTTFILNDVTNGLPVAGTVSYDQTVKTATFTPDSQLLPNTGYSATITGASDLAGNILPAKAWSFTTTVQDAVSPTVTATLPGIGASFVAMTASISATFSEEIKPNTADPQTGFTLTSASGAVSGKVGFNPATRTATFTPDAPLVNNTLYTAAITTAVTDLADNAATPLSWSFTTIRSETVLPIVAATVPAARSANVQINTPITATFSESIDPATINATTFKVAGLTGTVSYDDATKTATFTPTVTPGTPRLAFSTIYRPTLTTAVSDTAGNHLPLVNSWSFTTAALDNTPPTVTGTSPTDGATNVSIATTISAAFGEQIDPATFGPASVTVTGQRFANTAALPVNGTVSLIPGGGLSFPSALFTPAGTLSMGSVYTVKVSGITDLAGNLMSPDKIWSFTTMPDGIITPGAITATIADALGCLRVIINLIPTSLDARNHCDVAPLGPDGKPRPDGILDIRDALVILRKVVGLASW